MKQRVFLILALVFLFLILIGLNAASYVQKEKTPDNESRPNRSSFNAGATGTRAFYDYLTESGYKVTRWRESVSKLREFDEAVVSTFVVIGTVRRDFTDDEFTRLLNWVSIGGKLVIIDRKPPVDLVQTTSDYTLNVTDGKDSMAEIEKETLLFSVDPADPRQMTAETKAARPTQPTVFTVNLNAAQPSKFASSIESSRNKGTEEGSPDELPEVADIDESEPQLTVPEDDDTGIGDGSGSENESPPSAEEGEIESEESDQSKFAPVTHLANDKKSILLDSPFGNGRIVFLTDPYIVANGGIRLADNIQLASNIVGSRSGVIAFDEYHQGYGNNENVLLEYFSGTPLVALFLQLMALLGFVLFSQSRRFARALPENVPDRLSKLEYVSAMAQLQQRTKAFDLAIENIYSDFRRRVSRLVGVDNHTTSREELAALIAERTKYGAKEIEELMFKCEDITLGEPTGKKETVVLTGMLREVEEALGLGRRNVNRKR